MSLDNLIASEMAMQKLRSLTAVAGEVVLRRESNGLRLLAGGFEVTADDSEKFGLHWAIEDAWRAHLRGELAGEQESGVPQDERLVGQSR